MFNKKVIYPNICTVGNLFCGFFAIVSIVNNNYIQGAWLIILGTFFDGLDGWVARLTRGTSQFGIEFDSLADLITSGLAPSLLVYKLVLSNMGLLGIVICFVPVFCGAFRLARFNVQTRKTAKKFFMGMPIPLFSLTIASYVIFNYDIWGEIRVQGSLVPLMLFLSLLMVSTIRYQGLPHLSTRDVKKLNSRFFFYISVCLALVFYTEQTGFPIIFGIVLWGLLKGILTYIHQEGKDELADISL